MEANNIEHICFKITWGTYRCSIINKIVESINGCHWKYVTHMMLIIKLEVAMS
jgi:hypothetical protein